MGKKGSGVSRIMARFRGWIQAGATLLTNLHLPNFLKGGLYQGAGKTVCVPGLNCYSCPAASGACPIGAFQAVVGSSKFSFSYYITGFLILLGVLLGRFICGFLCPFGWFQELLHKIPSPKLRKNAFTQKLSLLKYAVAVIFVLLLPVYFWWQDGVGAPAFCKYICPAGTLEAGLPLLALNANLRDGIGLLFGWKFLLMLVILGACVFIYRPFCRFLCPLGAWYGLFNKLSAFGITVDKAKCTDCNACVRFCKMDCQKVNDRECINCGECKKICPEGAINFKTKF